MTAWVNRGTPSLRLRPVDDHSPSTPSGAGRVSALRPEMASSPRAPTRALGRALCGSVSARSNGRRPLAQPAWTAVRNAERARDRPQSPRMRSPRSPAKNECRFCAYPRAGRAHSGLAATSGATGRRRAGCAAHPEERARALGLAKGNSVAFTALLRPAYAGLGRSRPPQVAFCLGLLGRAAPA